MSKRLDDIKRLNRERRGHVYYQEMTWLIARVEKLEKASRGISNKINAVTAPHRHGQPVSKSKLDQLANRQIEFEKALEEDK